MEEKYILNLFFFLQNFIFRHTLQEILQFFSYGSYKKTQKEKRKVKSKKINKLFLRRKDLS